jgi:hypothetical protein
VKGLRLATGALAGAALIVGCSSAAKPPAVPAAHQVPAASACRDFATWFLANGSNILAGNDGSLLSRAASEAPSGQLYQDMSTLQSDVNTASVAQGDLQAAERA